MRGLVAKCSLGRRVTRWRRRSQQGRFGVECRERAKPLDQFFSSKLGVQVKVDAVRLAGNVLIVKMNSANDKQEVMKNKNKLAGTTTFIENDLTFEDRKKQEEIGKCCKEARIRGFQVKAGYGKVLFKGVWLKWEGKETFEGMLKESAEAATGSVSRSQEQTARLQEKPSSSKSDNFM